MSKYYMLKIYIKHTKRNFITLPIYNKFDLPDIFEEATMS